MAEPKTEQEPSIEEILESIRQIISEDGEPAAAPAAAAPARAPEPEIPAYTPPPAEPEPSPVFAAVVDDDDILDLTEKALPAGRQPEIDMTDVPEPVVPAYRPPPEPLYNTATSDDRLVSDTTADISAHAMARLLAGNVAVERDLPGRVGNVTLEDMTRELLRPLLKNWLDQNLPPLIERMVAKEIEKISRLATKQ